MDDGLTKALVIVGVGLAALVLFWVRGLISAGNKRAGLEKVNAPEEPHRSWEHGDGETDRISPDAPGRSGTPADEDPPNRRPARGEIPVEPGDGPPATGGSAPSRRVRPVLPGVVRKFFSHIAALGRSGGAGSLPPDQSGKTGAEEPGEFQPIIFKRDPRPIPWTRRPFQGKIEEVGPEPPTLKKR